MFITVSGEKKEVKDGITLGELITLEQVETPEYVTVSVNEEFVESEGRDAVTLKEGDVVEFLYFMGGGSLQYEFISVCVEDKDNRWKIGGIRKWL